jgi:fatty-acyl-CoA synthase
MAPGFAVPDLRAGHPAKSSGATPMRTGGVRCVLLVPTLPGCPELSAVPHPVDLGAGRELLNFCCRPEEAMAVDQRSSATAAHRLVDRVTPMAEQTIGDALDEAARHWGAATALVAAGDEDMRQEWSFAELRDDAQCVARALLRRYQPGEHIAIWAANRPEWPLVEFGAALAGLTLVTINPAYRAAELTHVLRQSKACGVLVQPHHRGTELLAVVESARPDLPGLRDVVDLSRWDEFVAPAGGDPLPDVAPGDIAQIQYTSGTTGFPKGAMLPHRGLVAVSRMFAEVNDAGPEDVWINPMPMFHTAGCGLATLGALQTGGTHVLPAGFDPARMLDLFEAERGTLMLSVPTMLIRMLDEQAARPRDVSSWRLSMLGGAPVAPELVRRAREQLGVAVTIGFGQTEASPYLTHTRPDDPNPRWAETVGPPLPGTEIRIVDPGTGQPLPSGAVGEICARGPGLMTGYFDDAEGTARALDADGWLHTGDLGSLDEDGYLRVQGRLKDMIIRGGENIYPREIEDLLLTHPDVADVSVVGIPDAEMGEQVAAFVRPRGAHRRSRPPGGLLPGAPRRVQDAPDLADGRGVPPDRLREDPEVRAPRALPRLGRRLGTRPHRRSPPSR